MSSDIPLEIFPTHALTFEEAVMMGFIKIGGSGLAMQPSRKPNIGDIRYSGGLPDLTEPVLAYRHWSLDKMLGMLKAPYQDFDWTAGENVALCQGRPHNLDRHNAQNGDRRYCSCGFYAVYSENHDYARQTRGSTVFGVIAAYGRVSLGEFGLRTEKAKIVALHMPYAPRWSPWRGTVDLLMQNYPEARFYKERANLIRMEDVHVPEELWQHRHAGRNFG